VTLSLKDIAISTDQGDVSADNYSISVDII